MPPPSTLPLTAALIDLAEMNPRLAILASLLAGLLMYCTPAIAGPGGLATPEANSKFGALPPIEPSPAYFEDGGWLVLTVPVVGDLLYACPPLGSPSPNCKSVVLPIRGPGSTLERWFIDPTSGAAWFKISVPPMGDYLLACFEPQGSPHCTLVEIERKPEVATLSRLRAETDGGGGPGGLVPFPPKPGSSTPGSGEANASAFWMTAALPVPGPVTLYACGGLDNGPTCRIALQGLDLIGAEDFGIQKLSAGSRGVVIGGIATNSVAERAGLREGDVVSSAAGFEILFPAHLKGLLSQVPVGDSIRLEVVGKGLVKLTRESRK